MIWLAVEDGVKLFVKTILKIRIQSAYLLAATVFKLQLIICIIVEPRTCR